MALFSLGGHFISLWSEADAASITAVDWSAELCGWLRPSFDSQRARTLTHTNIPHAHTHKHTPLAQHVVG